MSSTRGLNLNVAHLELDVIRVVHKLISDRGPTQTTKKEYSLAIKGKIDIPTYLLYEA